MGTFLFLLLLFFVIIPLIKVGWRVWLFRQQFKQAQQRMNDMFGEAQQSQGQSQSSSKHPGRRKKKIDPNQGEYVSFEEIEETDDTPEQNEPQRNSSNKQGSESQIEDAVWEDIK